MAAIAQVRRRRPAIGRPALLAPEAGNVTVRSSGSLHRPKERGRERGMGDFMAVCGIHEARMGGGMGELVFQKGMRRRGERLHPGGDQRDTFALEAARARLYQLRRPQARSASVSTWQAYLWLLLSEGGVPACRLHEGWRVGMATPAGKHAGGAGNRDAAICRVRNLMDAAASQSNVETPVKHEETPST